MSDEKSGKFVVRVPKAVHQLLVSEAEREGVSMNTLAMAKLTLPLSVLLCRFENKSLADVIGALQEAFEKS